MFVRAAVVVSAACVAIIAVVVELPAPRYWPDNVDWPKPVDFWVPQSDPGSAEETPILYRLPNNTRPLSYNVHITTHIHTQMHFEFLGEVAIRLKVIAPATRTIVLHQRQLKIEGAKLCQATQRDQLIDLNEPEYNPVNEFLTFTLNSTDLLVDTEYILTIEYLGTLRDEPHGFYKSSYIDDVLVTRWFAVTQFEQTDARHAFPCFDEPGLRAFFTIRITHGTMYTAVSNMPVASVVPARLAGHVTTTFQVTATTMPTYLVAFLVSDFKSKDQHHLSGFVQRIFARPKVIENGGFGLDTAVKCLDVLLRYFDMDFIYPKLDHVAIQYKNGAMENLGLMIYVENRLLFSKKESTFDDRLTIAVTVAHEVSHHWFGNLVTPKWWTHIWLNEGFATLYSYLVTDWVFPEWQVMDAFTSSVMHGVMEEDVHELARPMTHYVEKMHEIDLVFDVIVYSKASCVIYMMMHAFSEDTFKRGLIAYLKRKTNQVVDEEDLFADLEKVVKADKTLDSKYDVAAIFSSWTQQPGFPIVKVERNYKTGDIVLTQQRYMIFNHSAHDPNIWYCIPYNMITGAGHNIQPVTRWFSSRTSTIKKSVLYNSDWVLLNHRQTGYYRVKYDLRNYKMLTKALMQNHSHFHSTMRAQLLNDAFDMANFEHLNIKVALDLTKYLEHEYDYAPWAAAVVGLGYVRKMYSGHDNYAKFISVLRKQVQNIYFNVRLYAVNKKPHETHFFKKTRNDITRWACRLGIHRCLTESNAAVEKFLTKNVDIHQDHRSAILCSGMRSATLKQFNKMVEKLSTEHDPERRLTLVVALSCTTNVEIINTHLLKTIEKSSYLKTTEERRIAFIVTSANTPDTTLATLKFMISNIHAVNVTYGPGHMNTTLIDLVAHIVRQDCYDSFYFLVDISHRMGMIKTTTFDTVMELIDQNIGWMKMHHKDIKEWVNAEIGSANQVLGSRNLLTLCCMISLIFSAKE